MAFEDILDMSLNYWWWWGMEANPVDEYLSPRLDLSLRDEDWSFDYISFWVRKDNGQILYATDSGCSCPSPYEDHKVSDLKEVDFDKIPELLDSHADPYLGGVSASDLRKSARESLYPWLREQGARGA